MPVRKAPRSIEIGKLRVSVQKRFSNLSGYTYIEKFYVERSQNALDLYFFLSHLVLLEGIISLFYSCKVSLERNSLSQRVIDQR